MINWNELDRIISEGCTYEHRSLNVHEEIENYFGAEIPRSWRNINKVGVICC